MFPNDPAALRVTEVVVESHDEWAVAKRGYLGEESMVKRTARPVADGTLVITA